MKTKPKGYLPSFVGLWLGLLIIAVIVTILFGIFGNGISNSICGTNCGIGQGILAGIGGEIIGFILALFVGLAGLVVVIPLFIYICLRIRGLREKALRTSIYAGLFLLALPLVSLLTLNIGNHTNAFPQIGIPITILVSLLWAHLAVLIARHIALNSKPKQNLSLSLMKK